MKLCINLLNNVKSRDKRHKYIDRYCQLV